MAKELKVGELITIGDYSYSLRFEPDGVRTYDATGPGAKQQFRVLITNCKVPTYSLYAGTSQRFADVLVIGQGDNVVWLVDSDCVDRVAKTVEVRYFTDGKDVTDKLSQTSKREISEAQRLWQQQ